MNFPEFCFSVYKDIFVVEILWFGMIKWRENREDLKEEDSGGK